MAIATNAEKESLAIKYGADATHGALFTADPGTSGSVTGEVTGGSPAYARKALTWTAGASDGIVTASATFDVPTGTTVTHIAVCGGVSGANLLDRIAITSQTFSAQGTLVVNFTFTQS